MALKPVPIKPVEAHRLDDPRGSSGTDAFEVAAPASRPSTPSRSNRRRRAAPAPAAQTVPPSAASGPPAPAPGAEPRALVNPYARGGRPHQVAVSLFVPQWERIEEQCAELRAEGVRDAAVTRWLFAVLQFRAPAEREAAAELMRRWLRLEADESGPYFGLRRQARGVRFYEALWDRQRAAVADLRNAPGLGRPTLALWTTAVVELAGPKSAAEARELLRDLRLLLTADPD